jgi:hypothetical protein
MMELLADRNLPFDTRAARSYAELAVSARTAGKGFPTDGYIAAIAASHGFVIASRDTSAFTAAGLSVIDPWTTTLGPACQPGAAGLGARRVLKSPQNCWNCQRCRLSSNK